MIKKLMPVVAILTLCGLLFWQYDTQRALRETQQQLDDLKTQVALVDGEERALVPDDLDGYRKLKQDQIKLRSMAGIK